MLICLALAAAAAVCSEISQPVGNGPSPGLPPVHDTVRAKTPPRPGEGTTASARGEHPKTPGVRSVAAPGTTVGAGTTAAPGSPSPGASLVPGPPAGSADADLGGAGGFRLGAGEPAWVGSLHRGFSYAQVEAGLSYLNLQTLRVGDSLWPGTARASIFAPTLGFAGGIRLWFVELGVGYRAVLATAVSLSTVGVDVGCRVPVGRVETHFSVGAGVASVTQAANTLLNPSHELNLHGYHFGMRFGVDYYVLRVLSLGMSVDSKLVGVSSPELGDSNAPIARNLDGISLGIAISTAAVVALHL